MAANSLSPQEFSQRKLENLYRKTCSRLYPMKEGIKLLQEAVLLRKIFLSACLYAAIHFVFWNLYYLNDNCFSFLGRLLFWILLVDGFWVIATRDKTVPGQESSGLRLRLRRKREQTSYVSFEKAAMKNTKKLEVGEVAEFEVVCLWIAISLMWIDNVQLAMRHWNREQPYMLTVLLLVGGLVTCLLGYFIDFVLLVYIIVMLLLLWPVLSYYSVISSLTAAINTNYPIFTQKVQNYYEIMKRHFRRLPDDEFKDYQLDVPNPVPPGNQTPLNPSMSLTPFAPNFNVMDSMGASLMLQPGGFHNVQDDSLTLSSFSQARPHHPHTSSRPLQSLGNISEASNEEFSPTGTDEQFYDTSSASPLPPIDNEPSSRTRSDTLSLSPFDKNSSIHDSFDDLDMDGPGTSKEHGSSELSPKPSDSDVTSSGTGGAQIESPYFSSKLAFPSLISSTPSDATTTSTSGAMRHRVTFKDEGRDDED
ncbi:PREDICTED: uncharacterized protein LOC109581265 [Amphimedon queenslandica]|uniref:RETREG1-3/ARL6IP-like N-terminal reticulon-homology domain-containing protein n=1 Tax=Amphimedon queenslandica TaxID=400682 RepID=A0A1X7VW86_AMPQE|nr:PREDICTED: uncharacterized protein LOC109581265 [Amphimedon queenslandica]|eukprot:XP_019850792.1 PREDICTED: uncharacterized protein LOC109581265 [Amphimedon queenslandica]